MIHDIFEVDPYHKGLYLEETAVLLFLLSGNMTILLQEEHIALSACDLIAINPFESLAVTHTTDDAHTIVLRIPIDILRNAEASYRRFHVSCRLIADQSRQGYEVKRVFAELFWNHVKNEDGAEIVMQSLLYQLLHYLMKNFSLKTDTATPSGGKGFDRVKKAITYLQDHFREKLTLQSTAAVVGVTPGHLSRMLKERMSVSFSTYLTQLRLQEAVREFQQESAKSITEIAFDVGFGNINSFYVAFQKAFHMTPSAFRSAEQRKEQQALLLPDIKNLLQYRDEPKVKQTSALQAEHAVRAIPVTVHVDAKGTSFPHTWQKIINVGYAGEIISANVQRQLRIMQDSIGFTHLRFHGILDDDIHIYNEDKNGNPVLYFTYLDMILDFLDSIGLKPYLELSFIPSKLAKNLFSPFAHHAYISEVTSLEKWRYLVHGIVTHCVERYGLGNVKQWYFSFLGFNWVQCGYVPEYAMSLDAYYALYFAAYEEIKKINPMFAVGGPATDSFTLEEATLVSIEEWLAMCIKNNCPPDFIALHCYPVVGQDMMRSNRPNEKSNTMMMSSTAFTSRTENENYIAHHLKLLKQILRKAGLSKTRIIIDEWNSSLWQRDPISDTCFRSACIAKNIIENAANVTAMAQAFVSDYSIEAYPEKELFYGDIGMFTNNGIRKNVFHIYKLFSRLGNVKIAAGNGWAVFRKDQTLQLVLYYYCDYNRILGYTVTDFAKSDRYFVFSEREDRMYAFRFRGLESGAYILRDWRINREHGSAYDKWVQMGSPQNLTTEECNYLDRISEPAYYKQNIQYTDQTLPFTVHPHEVALVEIEPIQVL